MSPVSGHGDQPVDDMQPVFESMARYFSVLGEPTRLRILHTLCQDERCVNDIIRVTGLAQANASRHLGLMYQAGLLSRRREGTQIFYKVAEPLYVELCRTVSHRVGSGGLAAVLGAPDLASASPTDASPKEMSARPFADALPPMSSSAKQKDQASV